MKDNMTKAICSGKLELGSRELDCYVLEDRRRVIAERGFIEEALAVVRPDDDSYYDVIEFETPEGIAERGRETSFVLDLCREVLGAAVCGVVNHRLVSDAVDILVMSFRKGVAVLSNEEKSYN